MLEKARKLYHRALKWWRTRHLRRRLATLGVTECQEGPVPAYSEEYIYEGYVAPYSMRGGRTCSLGEKLGECRSLFGYKKPEDESIKLPSWDELVKTWVEAQENAAAAGDKD